VSLSWAKFESDVISGRIATTQPAATTAREIRLLKACALRHWRTRTATTRSRIACRRASGPPLKRCSRRSWPTFSVANAMAAGGSGERLPTWAPRAAAPAPSAPNPVGAARPDRGGRGQDDGVAVQGAATLSAADAI